MTAREEELIAREMLERPELLARRMKERRWAMWRRWCAMCGTMCRPPWQGRTRRSTGPCARASRSFTCLAAAPWTWRRLRSSRLKNLELRPVREAGAPRLRRNSGPYNWFESARLGMRLLRGDRIGAAAAEGGVVRHGADLGKVSPAAGALGVGRNFHACC